MIHVSFQNSRDRKYTTGKGALRAIAQVYEVSKDRFRGQNDAIVGIRNYGDMEAECAVIAEYLDKAYHQTVEPSTRTNLELNL